MGLGRSNPDDPRSHPGEPGVGVDLPPPFVAPDEATRWLFGLNRFGIRPGLVRIQSLLNDLGNPEKKLRTLVVAGTNGKGSTARVLGLLLQAAGHKVCTFTSPHLLNVHERIRINDLPVDPTEFSSRIEAIKPLTEKHAASWFETLTALAVQIARDEEVDYFCCETGLGGRLDSSNALPAMATLLTTIGLDHQRILGETLPEIAAEKLGLLKKGVPLFCGVDEELRGQVFSAAVTSGSPCYFLDELARWDPAGCAEVRPGRWDLILRDRVFSDLPDPGMGVMRRNVALALLALAELETTTGRKLLPADVSMALGNLFLPGRYQHLLSGPDWYLDTGHNIQALREVLREFLAQGPRQRNILLFGSMYDKSIQGDLPEIVAGFDLVLGSPVSLPRSRTVQELEQLLSGWGLVPVPWVDDDDTPLTGCTVAPDMESALKWLAARLKPEDRVLVTGSCFTVAEVFHRLGFEDLDQTRRLHPAAPVLARIDGEGAPGGS